MGLVLIVKGLPGSCLVLLHLGVQFLDLGLQLGDLVVIGSLLSLDLLLEGALLLSQGSQVLLILGGLHILAVKLADILGSGAGIQGHQLHAQTVQLQVLLLGGIVPTVQALVQGLGGEFVDVDTLSQPQQAPLPDPGNGPVPGLGSQLGLQLLQGADGALVGHGLGALHQRIGKEVLGALDEQLLIIKGSGGIGEDLFHGHLAHIPGHFVPLQQHLVKLAAGQLGHGGGIVQIDHQGIGIHGGGQIALRRHQEDPHAGLGDHATDALGILVGGKAGFGCQTGRHQGIHGNQQLPGPLVEGAALLQADHHGLLLEDGADGAEHHSGILQSHGGLHLGGHCIVIHGGHALAMVAHLLMSQQMGAEELVQIIVGDLGAGTVDLNSLVHMLTGDVEGLGIGGDTVGLLILVAVDTEGAECLHILGHAGLLIKVHGGVAHGYGQVILGLGEVILIEALGGGVHLGEAGQSIADSIDGDAGIDGADLVEEIRQTGGIAHGAVGAAAYGAVEVTVSIHRFHSLSLVSRWVLDWTRTRGRDHFWSCLPTSSLSNRPGFSKRAQRAMAS